MRTKQILLTLLLTLFAVGTWAQKTVSESAIVIWLNDGNKAEVLFEEMPVFSFDSGVITLKSEKVELSWPLENLKRFTFERVTTGIQDVKSIGLDIIPDNCVVYDLNGRVVRQNLKSLSELPKGVYIIKNGHVTTKVERK
jgi:hypothetical protein